MDFTKKRTIIVGAGFTGIQLARNLVAEGGDVTLIDNDAEKVSHSRNLLDCAVMQAEGNSLKTLEDAGIASAGALVTLTEDDETNMITCSLVEATHPGVLKIARVRNAAYYLSGPSGGLPIPGIDHTVNPDVEAADAICRAISHGAGGNVIELGGGFGIVSLSIAEGSALAGLRLRDLRTIPDWRSLVAYAESADGASLPSGETMLPAGGRVGVVCSIADIPQVMRLAAAGDGEPLSRVVVFGAGRVGALVVDRLCSARQANAGTGVNEILLVDSNEELCREAAERNADIRVMCAEITDEDFMQEERISECDLLVAASGNCDRNLVVSSYLKSRGVRRSIALTESSELDDVGRKLGVDVAVPLRDAVVDSIMSHLRGRNVRAVHTVCNRLFEIVECDVAAGSRVADKPLREISRPGEYLLLLIRHAGEEVFELPGGDTTVEAGARVVLVVRAGDSRIIRLFGGKA